MLSTGLRTPVGLKISGADLDTIEEIGARIESVLPSVKGTRCVFAERTGSGYFLDFEWNREALSRYGLSIDEAQEVIERAIGGENVTTTVEGRERYPVNVRYMRDFRSDLGSLGRVLVPAGDDNNGLGNRRHVIGALTLVVLFVVIIWVIIDLDQPRRGVILVSQQSMINLQDFITHDLP